MRGFKRNKCNKKSIFWICFTHIFRLNSEVKKGLLSILYKNLIFEWMIRFFLLSLILLSSTLHAQSYAKDTIILMNGNVVVEKVIDTLLGAVTIYHPVKPHKKIHYEYEDLYGIFYSGGSKKYYYRQDTARYQWFTRDEMYFFIKGEQDGRKGFRANGSLIGAGLSGLIGGASGTFFAPLLPFGYMALCGIPKVRIRHSTISNPGYIDYDAYILGYERSARYKRRIKSLLGGSVGLAIGYAIYFSLKDYYPTGYTGGKFTYN